MRDAKDVKVERAIVHIIDHLEKKDVVASEIELALDRAGAQPLRDYFTDQVNNALKDGQTGSAKFAAAGDQSTKDELFRILADQKQFVPSSQKLARSLLVAMGNDGRITPGNIVVCIFSASNYANKQFLALFKIDPTRALIEKIEKQNGKQVITFEVRSDVMPTAREKLHKAALIPPAGMDKKFDLLLLDRQVAAVAANFFALTFLNTAPVLDPVAATKTFLFGAEKARKILTTAAAESPERIGLKESDDLVQQIAVVAQGKSVDRINWPKQLPLKPEAQAVMAKQLEKLFPQDRRIKIDSASAQQLLRKTRYRGDHGVVFEVETDRINDVVKEQKAQPPLPDGTIVTRLVLEVPNFHRVTS